MRIFNFKKFNKMNGSFNEALKMNGFSVNNNTNSQKDYIFMNKDGIIKEAIDFEFEKKGGIIVFSTDVNTLDYSDNEFINKVKQVMTSIMNKVFTKKKVSKVMKKHDKVYGFTIGKFVKGRYKAKDGSIYDENSTSVEIIGIDSDTLLSVAEDIAAEFNQETVLVKDYQQDKIYLADSNKDSDDD